MGWTNPFINSLAFSVMLTWYAPGADLYFWRDWLTLIPPAWPAFATSLRDDPDRKMAWLLVVATIPACSSDRC